MAIQDAAPAGVVNAAGALSSDLPSERPLRHLGYLDSLRGLAILGVLLVHAGFSVVDIQHVPLAQILFIGQRGVQLFYLVSAFTLFYTLDTQRRDEHPKRNFYLRRFFRIAPLFYLDLIFKAWVLGRGMSLPLYLSAVVFLNGWSHTAINIVPAGWSIAVEVTFYAFVPFLFTWIRNLRQALVGLVVATAVSVPLCYGLAKHVPGDFYTFLWFPAEAPVFMMGIVAYFLWKGRLDPAAAEARTDVMPAAERRGLSLALLLVSAALIFGAVNLNADLPGQEAWRNTHLLFASLGFIPLLLAVALHEPTLLVNRFTRFLGRISYSVYLSHGYVMILIEWIHRRWFEGIFHGRLHNTVGGVAVSLILLLALSIPVSMLLWRIVEQPGIRLGRRIIAALEGRTDRSEAVASLGSAGNSPDAQF
ncbi:MAG TPA: acyltransferase [Acidobacteriaceae bacterium]|nr:acyltransferase [Acidobacteriaceae bacterium]